MSPEALVYPVIGIPIALPALTTAYILYRRLKTGTLHLDRRGRHALTALKLLMAQTLLPALQFLLALNVHVDRPSSLWVSVGMTTVLVVAIVLCPLAVFALVAYCRGPARLLFPLLSLLTSAFWVILFLSSFAVA